MRCADVYLAGTGAELPDRVLIEHAVAAGDCPPAIAASTRARSVTVAGPGQSPPDLAATASRRALADAAAFSVLPQDIDILLYADVYYQGQDLWPPGSYVQRLTGVDCPAIEIRQMSNGGMAALELAANHLAADPTRRAALITAADVFAPPGFDRWRSDPGTVYADGGVALVLSRTPGFARVRSIASVSDPELEGMHRGDDPFGPAPLHVRQPMDLTVWKDAFVVRVGQSFAVARTASGAQEATKRALADADAGLAEIDWFVLPHFGRRRLELGPLRQFGIDADRTTWSWSRTVGHLGAGDQIASIDHLRGAGRLSPGQLCLFAGVGAGFTWSCAVVEIL